MKKSVIWILVLAVMAACLIGGGMAEENVHFKTAAPNGAPGVVLAVLAVENPDDFAFVAAETITAEFASKTSDFIIAPINAGAKLYKAGKSEYRLAAVVTWGNLYIATQRKDFQPENLKDCKLTLFGENTINASVVLYALQENGIVPAETEYLAGAAETKSLLLSDPEAVVVTAEPALTAARFSQEAVSAWSVNELLQKATGYDGYTQAGLFVKKETVEQYPKEVDAFLKKVEDSANTCTDDLNKAAEAAVQMGILPNMKVAAAAIPNCSIRYLSAAEAKQQIETTAGIDLSQFGGAVPEDEFYYAAP